MLNIIIADDHTIVRDGIKLLLDKKDDFTITGEAENGQQVLDMLSEGVKANVVLADVNMPGIDGITLIQELKKKYPHIRPVVLSMLDDLGFVKKAMEEGAAGYLLKTISANELIFAIEHVGSGKQYLYSGLSAKLLGNFLSNSETPVSDGPRIEFSTREIEILQLLAEGLTNSEMADKLYISKRTIEGHRQNLLDKTGTRNTAALIRFVSLNRYL